MYDIAIIGTGPAGISAAITAKLRGKNIILFGSKKLSGKIEKANLIKNYPGFPEISGADLASSFKNHLEKMQIEITEATVRLVYAMGDYFELETSVKNQKIQSRSVILATGVLQSSIVKGEAEFLGRGVSYCATCDGFFYKNKVVAVVADSSDYESEVKYLSEIAQKVLYFPKYGLKNLNAQFASNVEILDEDVIEIEGENTVNLIKTRVMTNENCAENLKEHFVNGVFFLRNCVAASSLVPGLKTDEKYIEVDLQMKTNIPGVFACGDVTGTPYQYIKSAGQGNVAALSAVEYLK